MGAQGSVPMYLRPTSSGVSPQTPEIKPCPPLSHPVAQHLPLEGSPGCLTISCTSAVSTLPLPTQASTPLFPGPTSGLLPLACCSRILGLVSLISFPSRLSRNGVQRGQPRGLQMAPTLPFLASPSAILFTLSWTISAAPSSSPEYGSSSNLFSFQSRTHPDSPLLRHLC